MPYRDQPAPPQLDTVADLRGAGLEPQLATLSAFGCFSVFLPREPFDTQPPHDDAARSVGVAGPQLLTLRLLAGGGLGAVRLMEGMRWSVAQLRACQSLLVVRHHGKQGVG